MIEIADLEKKINSELNTKIKKTEIKHKQLYIEIDKEELINVILFLKTNKRSTDPQMDSSELVLR